MPYPYLETLSGPRVAEVQQELGSYDFWSRASLDRDFVRFTEKEAEFIQARDSFYLASMSESGWPYLQHRGGPPGFLKVVDETTLAFDQYAGNRQYITLGNVRSEARVSLFLMDYAARRRLKILAHMSVEGAPGDGDQFDPDYAAVRERRVLLRLEAFDWNCPQHIRRRFDEDQVAAMVPPLQARIEELEAQLASKG